MKKLPSATGKPRLLAAMPETVELGRAAAELPAPPEFVRRLSVAVPGAGPLRISAEIRTEGVTGVPGSACMVFCNVEYTAGPIFWDTFLYPDTGTTPWRLLSCEVRDRGAVAAVELHVRFQAARGRLLLRNLRVETLPPWPDDAEILVAIFGDSTDMTNYLATDLRAGRRLELLLRDRFADRRVDVRCLAEGGEYLQRLLESGRLERELRCLPRCDIALIRYGLNDRPRQITPAAFGSQLRDACAMVRRHFPEARILLSTTIPPDADCYKQETIEAGAALGLPVLRLDEHLRALAAAGNSDWHHQPGSRIGRRRSTNPPGNPDGLAGDKHPNALGAQAVAEFYFSHLESLLAACLGPAPATPNPGL